MACQRPYTGRSWHQVRPYTNLSLASHHFPPAGLLSSSPSATPFASDPASPFHPVQAKNRLSLASGPANHCRLPSAGLRHVRPLFVFFWRVLPVFPPVLPARAIVLVAIAIVLLVPITPCLVLDLCLVHFPVILGVVWPSCTLKAKGWRIRSRRLEVRKRYENWKTLRTGPESACWWGSSPNDAKIIRSFRTAECFGKGFSKWSMSGGSSYCFATSRAACSGSNGPTGI